MALTNGITLWNKIKTIADAIRGKINKTDSLTIDQMVNEINTNWHAYVKEVIYKGNFNEVGSLIGLIWSYTPDGKLVLTSNSNSSNYEHVYWKLGACPAGIGITTGRKPDNWEPTGEPEQFYSCILTGISQNCRLTVEQSDTSSTYDYVEVTITIEYI